MASDVKPSSLRAEQARGTQRRIVAAARALLLEHGYAGTTMAAVARAAGVAVQTVYNAFGTKAALAKRVLDVTVAGDDEDVPIRARPEGRAVDAEADPRRKLAGAAHLARLLSERAGPLLAVLSAGRGSDPELDQLLATSDDERLRAATRIVGGLDPGDLRDGVTQEEARDLLWLLYAPEVYARLVEQRGWSLDAYERWLGDLLVTALLPPP
jgi:AcrR family transcriptional regulator